MFNLAPRTIGLLTSFDSQQLLKQLLQQLHQEQQLNLPQLINIFQEVKQEYNLPLSIFSTKLPPAEALCRYLSEEEKLSCQEIAQLLSRNEKSIWATSQRAKKRKPLSGKVSYFNSNLKKYFIPLSVLQNRDYSLLESVILYLNQVHHLSNKEIAGLLRKSPNSVAVLLKRAQDKSNPHQSAQNNPWPKCKEQSKKKTKEK